MRSTAFTAALLTALSYAQSQHVETVAPEVVVVDDIPHQNVTTDAVYDSTATEAYYSEYYDDE
jgi:hypothetical protein